MKKKYIIEIEKNAEVITDGGYLTPDEIVCQVMFIDNNGEGENYKKIAEVETLEEARRIFNENKKSCSSKQVGRKLTADVLRIREINFDNEGNELDPDGMDILDTYAAILDGYVLNKNDEAVDFEFALTYMDDEICEELNNEMSLCTDQEFFTAYEKRHYAKFGEHFAIATAYELECRKGLYYGY